MRAANQNFVPVLDDCEVFIGIVPRKPIIEHCAFRVGILSATSTGGILARQQIVAAPPTEAETSTAT